MPIETITDELLLDFKKESQELLTNIEEIVDELSDNPEQKNKLEEFGQKIDRIMGAAKTFAEFSDLGEVVNKKIIQIGDYCELCKTASYKASQVNDISLVTVVVAFLSDGVEKLISFVETIDVIGAESSDLVNETFLNRLKWIQAKFDTSLRGSVEINKGNKD